MLASRELRTVRFLYNSLQFLAAQQNPVWNKTWQCSSYFEKKKIIVQRRRGFSMLLFPLPCARNKKNGNIESRILIGCVPAGSKEKIVVDEAVF